MTEQGKILVTGATGNVGGRVVSQLAERGVDVRAFVRDPDHADLPAGVAAVRGDLSKPETLEAGLGGVDSVFLVWPFFSAEGAPAVVDAIAGHARRVVYLSSEGVKDGAEEQTDPINGFHAEIERLIGRSGLEWTFLRAAGLAANALGWAEEVRSGGDVVREPHGAAARSPVHERDIAAVAVRALTETGHGEAKYVLTGPEVLTKAEQVRAIGEAIGSPLRFEDVPEEQAREEWVAAGLPPAVADGIFGAHARFAEEPEPVTATVEEITGTPARPFREWALEHAGDFRDARTEALAKKYVRLFGEGDLEGATGLFAEGFVRAEQTEAFGPPVELRGDEVARFMESNMEEEEIHAFEIGGPFVGGDPNRFAVRFSFDSTFRSTGERKRYSKVCLYTAEDGKLVREEVYHEPLG
jgi:uncharacterized protein YbjT (DUF2867 family)